MKKILAKFLVMVMVLGVLLNTNIAETQAATKTVSTFAQLKAAFRNGGRYFISNDIKATSDLEIPSGVCVTIYTTNKVKTINMGNYGITVNNGGDFKIGDTYNTTWSVKIKSTSTQKAAVKVNKGGIFVIYRGSVVGGRYSVDNYGAFGLSGTNSYIADGNTYSIYNAGTFALKGGHVYTKSGKTGIYNVGKVNHESGYADGNDFNNNSKGRCAVENEGVYNIKGGCVCNATYAGIFNKEKGTVNISNGNIFNISNSSENYIYLGAGIRNKGKLSITGGQVSNCTAGIFNTGIFEAKSLKVYNCTSNKKGWGIINGNYANIESCSMYNCGVGFYNHAGVIIRKCNIYNNRIGIYTAAIDTLGYYTEDYLKILGGQYMDDVANGMSNMQFSQFQTKLWKMCKFDRPGNFKPVASQCTTSKDMSVVAVFNTNVYSNKECGVEVDSGLFSATDLKSYSNAWDGIYAGPGKTVYLENSQFNNNGHYGVNCQHATHEYVNCSCRNNGYDK